MTPLVLHPVGIPLHTQKNLLFSIGMVTLEGPLRKTGQVVYGRGPSTPRRHGREGNGQAPLSP